MSDSGFGNRSEIQSEHRYSGFGNRSEIQSEHRCMLIDAIQDMLAHSGFGNSEC